MGRDATSSEKSPASTDRRFHGRESERAEEGSQEETGRSVPGISFQPQHESSPQTDESTESIDLGVGVGNCSTEWMSPLANVGWRGREDHKGRRSTGDRMECSHPCVG